jgi:pimeloyl-ACP methyl ester carboxylesterase
MKDNYIPDEVFEKLVSLAPHAKVLRLSDSGHMGFIEEPESVIRALVEMV